MDRAQIYRGPVPAPRQVVSAIFLWHELVLPYRCATIMFIIPGCEPWLEAPQLAECLKRNHFPQGLARGADVNLVFDVFILRTFWVVNVFADRRAVLHARLDAQAGPVNGASIICMPRSCSTWVGGQADCVSRSLGNHSC